MKYDPHHGTKNEDLTHYSAVIREVARFMIHLKLHPYRVDTAINHFIENYDKPIDKHRELVGDVFSSLSCHNKPEKNMEVICVSSVLKLIFDSRVSIRNNWLHKYLELTIDGYDNKYHLLKELSMDIVIENNLYHGWR